MTRINTNVSSLIAQTTLQRSNAQLQTSLTRLSTGLRINSGKDDPSGLIASENLRSDIVSVQAAISNTERANQIIATADSALGQVSSLLNDIRGLVTESANEGALTPEQVAANQLQVDSSLEALNRISQTTTFQGRRLLDGSLDFISNAGSVSTIESVQIDQANLGAAGEIDVDIDISAAAAQATLSNSVPAATTGSVATASLTFASETFGNQPTINTIDFTGGGQLVITSATDADQDITSVVLVDNTTEGATFASGVLTITANFTAGRDADELAAIVDGDLGTGGTGDFASATGNGTTAVTQAEGASETITKTQTGSAGATGTESIDFTTTANAADTRTVTITEASGQGTTPGVAFATNGTDIIITVDDTAATALSAIVSAFDTFASTNSLGLDASIGTGYTGDGNFDPSAESADVTDTFSGGAADTSAGLQDDVVFELSGLTGSEVFSFTAGTTATQIRDAIRLVADAIGVTADVTTGSGSDALDITSTDYGSDAFVNISVISEGSSGTFESGLGGTFRSTGSDIAATVNGVNASGNGNTLSLNTATLDLTLSVTAGSSADIDFSITGGGALFQLGPDVVSNQQARLGIQSVNTARLGGASGRLFGLASGGTAALAADPTTAAAIVEEAINQVTGLRGRLGAFQKTTLESNLVSLNDTLVNLTDAESAIRDADFAEETAQLTRAQILVQSGTSVLQIANQNPQNVLALLR
jgi:flagellin